MCENNYGYIVPCPVPVVGNNGMMHNHHVGPSVVGGGGGATTYEDESYFLDTWPGAEYVPNNGDQLE